MFIAAALTAVKGFCMGAADVVPGVSGGTIALLFGIYERLVRNIRQGSQALGRLAQGDVRGAWARIQAVEWVFLGPLLAGVLAAVVALASLIDTLLEDHPENMAGLFAGLVIASIVVAWPRVRDWTATTLGIAAVVALVTFIGLGARTGFVADPGWLHYFGAAAVAICAMILPGISGSFLLLMLGMYAAVIEAVDERHFDDLAVFAAGAVLGLALFSSLLSWLLEHHHDPMLAALIGLMAGSLRVLWPWPHGVGVIADSEDEVVNGAALDWPDAGEIAGPSLLALAAVVVVIGVSVLAEARAGSPDPQVV